MPNVNKKLNEKETGEKWIKRRGKRRRQENKRNNVTAEESSKFKSLIIEEIRIWFQYKNVRQFRTKLKK